MPFLRQSTSQVIRFGPALDKTDGVTEETALTLAQADMRLSKDGGAFAQKSAAGNATHDSDGWYSTTLSTTDTGTVGELRLNVHQPANMLPVWDRWWVLEEAVYDAMYGASAAGPLQPTTAGRTLDVAATGEAGIDLGNVTGILGNANVGWIDSNDRVGANVERWKGSIPNSVTNGDLPANMKAISGRANPANILDAWLNAGVQLGADSGTTTTLVDATLNEADDFWNNSMLLILDGSNVGHAALVRDFDAATNTLTFAPASPSNITTESYVLVPGLGISSVQAWLQTAVTLSAGAPDVNIQSTDDIDLSATQKASVNTEADTALSDIDLDHLVNTATAIPAVTAGTFLDQMFDDGTATYNRTTDSLQAIRDHIADGTNLTEAGGNGDHLTAINLPNQTMDITGNITGNLSGSVGSVTGAVGSVTGSVGSVTGHTNQTGDNFARIGAAGAGLTDLGGMSDGMKAEVESEVNDALIVLGLDHLISASVSDTDVADDSIIAQMVDAGSTSDYTNYSKTEDSLRAISEKVSSIGSASGGGFNFAAVGADALTDTINDAEPAVDKSTSPATVGIPVTGHAFLAGHEVTIAGTVSYNGSFVIDSVTTNEVVIVSAFSAETFSGTDTIVSSIKAESIEGVETTNTFSATVSEDGVFHVIDDDGANNFTISYRFEVGGGRLATEAVFHGFLNGSNDNALIQAYDFVGSAWETRALLTGQNGSVNQTITISLLARNTGTSATDLGVTFLRITDDTPRGSSNPTLNVDSLLVEAAGVGQTAGYQNGAIWVDTIDGTAGTENFVNGTADKAVLTWADALTLSGNLGITDFHIINGSTITLSATSDNFSLFGDNWTLDLNGQSIASAHFEGAAVSGVGTGASASFIKGEINTCTFGNDTHIDEVSLIGPITLPAGDMHVDDCHHAGSGAVVIDFGAVGSTTLHMHGYEGNVEVQNMGDSGTDILHLDGHGTFTANSNGAGGTVNLRGLWKVTANNATVNFDDSATIINKLDSAQAEPGQATPAVNETPLQKLAFLYKQWRNKSDNDGSTIQLYNDDTTTVDQKRTVSEAAGTVTKNEVATGP